MTDAAGPDVQSELPVTFKQSQPMSEEHSGEVLQVGWLERFSLPFSISPRSNPCQNIPEKKDWGRANH
jgi:hypothetical protein